MAKKKRSDKDNNKNGVQEGDLLKPEDAFYGVSLRPDNLGILGLGLDRVNSIVLPPDTLYGSLTLSQDMINSIFKPTPDTFYGSLSLRPETFASLGLTTDRISREQKLEDDIFELTKEKKQLLQEVQEKSEALKRKEIRIEEHQRTIEKLGKKEEEILQQQKLQYLFYRVHPRAWEKLQEDRKFRRLFEQKTPCRAVIMAIDIRRSTELMLKAKDADSYQSFIVTLCAQLKQIILDNYGVFDKFTGDGILSFFPEFYSGDDATYLAVKAADECHACFFKHYENNRSCFTTILKDVGLGIGIDYGDTRLVNIQDWFTVIGTPVVYACRLSGAPAGQTLLNQQAYDLISQKFGGYINFQDSEILIKNEGNILVYIATLAKKTREIKLPTWLKSSTSTQS